MERESSTLETARPGVFAPLACWAVSGAVVFLGVYIGQRIVTLDARAPFLGVFSKFDGEHYLRIARAGYTFTPGERSELAFFPAYPLTARYIDLLTDAGPTIASLIASNVFLALSFVLLAKYMGARSAEGGVALEGRGLGNFRALSLAAFAVVPCSFFFRLAYSESCFLAVAILCLLAMERRWPLASIAILVGLCTATRPVGVALLLPFLWHLRSRSSGWGQFSLRAVWLGPLACWGLIAYAAMQYARFGDPLIFVATQDYWRVRPQAPLGEKMLAWASWEPIWSVYIPGGAGDWRRFGDELLPLFNMQFMNPIYFVGTAALVGIGARKRWMTVYEILASVSLLAIPYITKGYENAMLSHGRFAAVVFPAYIVVGHVLARLPPWLAWSILGLSAALMGIYAGEYAAGKMFF